jgi:hypothetical protein
MMGIEGGIDEQASKCRDGWVFAGGRWGILKCHGSGTDGSYCIRERKFFTAIGLIRTLLTDTENYLNQG